MMTKRLLHVIGLGLWLMGGCGGPEGELESDVQPAVEALTASPGAAEMTTGTTSTTAGAPGGQDCGACVFEPSGHAYMTCSKTICTTTAGVKRCVRVPERVLCGSTSDLPLSPR